MVYRAAALAVMVAAGAVFGQGRANGQERICIITSRELSAVPGRAPAHTVGDLIQVLRGADTVKCATIQTQGEQADIFLAFMYAAPSNIIDRALELMQDSTDASGIIARAARKMSIVDDLTTAQRNALKTRGKLAKTTIDAVSGKSLTIKDKGPQ